MVTLKSVKQNEEVKALIRTTEKQIDALAYTEHSNRHAGIVSSWTGMILKEIGESAKIISVNTALLSVLLLLSINTSNLPFSASKRLFAV